MNRPAPFPMQPLDASAPDALRLAWYKAERAWKWWQHEDVVLKSIRAGHVPHSVEIDAIQACEKAEAGMHATLDALTREYQLTALSTMDGATQRTA